MNNNILALDLSTKSTGYSVSDGEKLLDYGCITSASLNNITRIYVMRDAVAALIKKYNIKTVVVEEVRTDYKNAHTYKLLTWLQAAIVFCAYDIDKKIEIEYI
jgi:Holliday junction resolvasome RuvABC endonuclease subunit